MFLQSIELQIQYIILPFLMADHDELQLYVHKIYQTLTQYQNLVLADDFKEKSTPKIPQQNLYEKINQQLALVKREIISILQMVQSNKRQKITDCQKKILIQLQKTLGSLNKQITFLLRQGILNVYIQLLNLRQKTLENNLSTIIQNFIQDIIQVMSKLLFSYFCCQQYKNRAQQQLSKTLKPTFSLKNISQPISRKQQQLQFDFQLMKNIELNMKKSSIQQIISQYMEKQVAKITIEQSLCKICSQKILLRNIQRHVKLCQKQFDLKQDCQLKKRRMSELLNQMRKELWQINLKTHKSKPEQSFKTIVTLLLYKQNSKREKGNQRRSQSFKVTTTESDIQTFISLVQQHTQQHGDHQILRQICKLQMEIISIEKNINGLQLGMLNLQKHSLSSLSLQREPAGQGYCPKSKNSLEMGGTLNCLSTSGSLPKGVKKSVQFNTFDQSQQQDEKENRCRNKSVKQSLLSQNKLLKKYQSKKYVKQKQNRPPHEIKKEKHYVSLQEISFGEQTDKKISFADFQVLKLIGKGAYGKVYMVRRKQTEDVYALKIIQFSEKVTERQLELIAKQHQIYKKIAGDYLVKAPFSFTEKSSHMFVLQYMCGGDFRKMLNQQIYFEQSAAKFYLAQIILAIEHLHKFNIIHRDLKPQNLVLDQDGHLKLTDFGLSELKLQTRLKQTKKLTQHPSIIRRKSRRRAVFRNEQNKAFLIGTPDYIAPQIINYVSTNNTTIDWWSLGVIAYELIIGTRPFCANTIDDVLQNVKEFNIQWPQVGDEEGMITQKAKDLIERLLNKDFLNRLGANGAGEIKAHPFFQGINWENIKRSTPPFKPDIEKSKKQFLVPENKKLRQEIQKTIEVGARICQSKLKLDKFVRFDLLGSETMQSVEKIFNEKANHLTKLKTLQKLQKSKSHHS